MDFTRYAFGSCFALTLSTIAMKGGFSRYAFCSTFSKSGFLKSG